MHLNGKLTLGENTADNGGLRIAYMALEDALDGKSREKIDGYTPEQRFFLGFAQVWCESRTEAEERRRANVDPHSPGRYRVNGSINMPEFWKAYGCKEGQPMVRAGMPAGSGSLPEARVMLVAAHPDDEIIVAGSRLAHFRDLVLVHVTDGAPRNMFDAGTHGFTRREDYAAARRNELLCALKRLDALLNLSILASRIRKRPQMQRRLPGGLPVFCGNARPALC